jgi:hemin uptake protein HemP
MSTPLIKEPHAEVPERPKQARPERVVSTRELLGNAHRIWIEHSTERYLLQVTRSGKLILTK